jgi:hypothetical protein
MSYKTCPDWPELMEIAPDLQFKHHDVSEARLPAEALAKLEGVLVSELEICADLDHYVYNAEHTDPTVAEALRGTHWYELAEWTTSGPGTATALG